MLSGRSPLKSVNTVTVQGSEALTFYTGAVCGNIFASPNAKQVRNAIDLVDNDKGYITSLL